MSNMNCSDKFCEDILKKIPEKDRDAFIQDLEKLTRSCEGLQTCCQSRCNCKDIPKSN
jgi:hypothetical protein